MSEVFNHSDTCCDDCFTPPEEKIKRQRNYPKATDATRIRSNRKNPKAKELYKKLLLSNS